MASSLLFNYKYLSREKLNGFEKYKYKSVDTSPLSNYVMHPFWDQLVKIFPMWVPANILTLFGWICSLSCFLLCSYFDVHFISQKEVPRWVWLLSGILIFFAHQLDGCDGKQARRTNSSSPIGELFDHGLDSSAVSLMCISILSLFGVSEHTGTHWEITLIFMLVLFSFYIPHWEKYNTSVMFLPWAYDVSQILLVSSFIASFFYGTEIWRVSYFNGALNLTFILKFIFYFLFVFLLFPVSIINQYQARKKTPKDCVPVIEGLYPLVAIVIPTFLYLLFGYWSDSNIVITNLRLYIVGYGLLYSNITCRLIISQMTSTKCDRFNILAWPLFPMLVAAYLKLINDKTMLVVYTIFLTLAHIHYGINVVHQLCMHLNVYCFRVNGKVRNELSKELHKSHINGKEKR
ncbi:ethanolaminephosphotransferase 1 isoform X1 [Hydra vulgaris]|uniref:ethanolaminephosphotransferase 1 isoform X1 n=1 Tax=Hydra vulgaris TaxID=6087 RepID=UPI001F5FE8A9|nr:ethanolaminephosphotransferase 1-like [Hydra vulgaris]